MADSTIDSELITLVNNWGIAPSVIDVVPTDGFTGSKTHNVATRAAPIGEVRQVRCDGSVGKAGYSQFIYLQVGTQNPDVAMAVKHVVAQDSATVWYQVTNDPDTALKLPTGLAAIALSAMTDDYYGWFWCGGVCPEQFVSGLGGTYKTNDGVAIGQFTAHNLDADYIGLDVADTAGEGIFGYALAADT